jgi:hypothetical protein
MLLFCLINDHTSSGKRKRLTWGMGRVSASPTSPDFRRIKSKLKKGGNISKVEEYLLLGYDAV